MAANGSSQTGIIVRLAKSGDIEALCALLDSPSWRPLSTHFPRDALEDIEEAEALRAAATMGHAPIALELLRRGVFVDGADSATGESALHFAARNDNTEILEILLNFGASIDQRNSEEQRTALHIAALLDNNKTVTCLLNRGAAIELIDKFGNSALMLACENASYYCIQSLLNRGAKVDTKNTFTGKSALSYVASTGNTACLKLLLERSDAASVNSQDRQGTTPLMEAARANSINVIASLLDTRKCDLNLRDSIGRTALHYATLSHHRHSPLLEKSALDIIILAGIDVKIKNNSGHTALDVLFKFTSTSRDEREKNRILALVRKVDQRATAWESRKDLLLFQFSAGFLQPQTHCLLLPNLVNDFSVSSITASLSKVQINDGIEEACQLELLEKIFSNSKIYKRIHCFL